VTGPIEPADNLGPSEGYHSPQVEVAVRLNTNESPLPPPPEFVAALREALTTVEFHRYPDRHATELRAALAKLHGTTPDRVFVGNGSNEVLQTICLTYGGPGRTAVVFEPTYAMHAQIARVTGTRVVAGERAAGFVLDLAEVEAVLARECPAITFVCSPNNPTGRAEERDVVERVLDLAPGLAVVDEAYGQFSRWSAVDLVDDDRPLAVVRTFSKTWSMAAARLGYTIAPAWLVAELEKRVLPYHLDTVKQLAGTIALRYQEQMEARVAAIIEDRGRIAAALGQLDVDTWPSDANFILFRPRSRDARDVWKALLDRSILVRDWSRWPRLDGCLRVTVGTPAENDAFVAALTEILEG
jgi:histidinol-phosphate aminotransferase